MTLEARLRVERGPLRLAVDLRVLSGTVLAVMGPNGSGKSTLLEAIAGLVAVREASVRLDGRVLADTAVGRHVPPHERGLGVAPQDGLLFGHLSARENVAFGRRAQGVRASVARAAADELLAEVGLAAHTRTRADRLSGGQAQRVALARAIAARPAALLLDEPFGALDAATRRPARHAVRRAVAHGLPALVVTHDPRDALDLADELLVLEDGEPVQRGRPADVLADPATPYVRRVAAAVTWGDGHD